MLGPPKPRRLDAPIAVSLEELTPANHFYRHLETKLDLRGAGAITGSQEHAQRRLVGGGASELRLLPRPARTAAVAG
jgi:hypothetical protein